METLILGHGTFYNKESIRCSPIDVDEWFNSPYDSVDKEVEVNPTFVYDLRKLEWTFTNKLYDKIIDTAGIAFYRMNDYNPIVFNNVKKLLKPNGIFYSLRFTAFKQNDNVYINKRLQH